MLNALYIRNFRLIRELHVKRLARMNLIVGRNNSGKTALLEALQLYAGNALPATVMNLVAARQEFSSLEAFAHQDPLAHPLRHLFPGHELPDHPKEGRIEVGIDAHQTKSVWITIALQKYLEDGRLKTDIDFKLSELDESIQELRWVSKTVAGHAKVQSRLSGDSDVFDFQLYRRRNQTNYLPCYLVPSGHLDDQQMASLWDLTSLETSSQEIIEALSMIDDRIVQIAYVESKEQRINGHQKPSRIPWVKLRDHQDPLPLRSLGDGVSRLFQMLVALANARNGLLLIDEFENGLHWSVQPKIWEVLLATAERLNVQIFATTHSRDCIAAFDQIWNKDESKGAFIRLEPKANGQINVTEYNSETLTDSLEMNIEVR